MSLSAAFDASVPLPASWLVGSCGSAIGSAALAFAVGPMSRARGEEGGLERLMERYAEGDEAAFAALYDELAGPLFGFLLRLTRERSVAEDLVHETFLRIHRARGAYRTGSPVLPWAYAIARRLFLDDIRRFRRERLAVEREDDRKSDPGIPATDASAEEIAAARALEAVIESELAKLPESQATAFRLLKQEELTIAEAAAVLGATETTVKLRAHRAYVALRKALVGKWDETLLGAEP